MTIGNRFFVFVLYICMYVCEYVCVYIIIVSSSL